MESTLKTYIDELRYSLSLRNVEPATIRDIAREVESEATSYEDAVASFGTPEHYATSFPSTASPKSHSAFLVVGVLLAALWAVLTIIFRDRQANAFSGWAITWLPVFGLIAAGIIVDFSRSLLRSRASR
ncbi:MULTISPECIES: hypothetical protein [Micrococcaceae]|uniref:hypothetical protein n=1 Tax=Micrococcaceae TaxID=1268 RepID=UPI00103575F4|nr:MULTISPECIES: hypothetical protein [Micrococcaceae]TAP28709.1 hypothetical protein EYR88_10630 [Arthrobacter sp. S41]UXN32453.1 hypothetical protein N6V40_02955 [Glutamicibacter sp. M10]